MQPIVRRAPAIVTWAAYGGGAGCLIALALCVFNLVNPAPAATTPDALWDRTEVDRIVFLAGVLLSCAGLAVCAGLLRANATSYRVFLSGLKISMVTAGVTALVATAYWAAACLGLALLQHGMTRDPVRSFFALEPARPGAFIRRFARANIVLGASSAVFLLWPGDWQSAAFNLALGAGSVALGYGILHARLWVRPVAVVLSVGTVLYAAGLAWNPDVPISMGLEAEVVGQVAMALLAFSAAWASFLCWLVYARWEQIQAAATPKI